MGVGSSPEARVGIGCDDGRVSKLGPGSWTLLSCVSLVRDGGGLYPSGVQVYPLRVDGLDATSLISHATRVLARDPHSSILFLDSITIGGFNVVSPPAVYRLARVPVVVTYTYRPSYQRLASAASRLPTFPLLQRVLQLADGHVSISTPRGPLYIITWGISPAEAVGVIESFQVHSRKPEPVRVAHYLASALSRLARLEPEGGHTS